MNTPLEYANHCCVENGWHPIQSRNGCYGYGLDRVKLYPKPTGYKPLLDLNTSRCSLHKLIRHLYHVQHNIPTINHKLSTYQPSLAHPPFPASQLPPEKSPFLMIPPRSFEEVVRKSLQWLHTWTIKTRRLYTSLTLLIIVKLC